MDLALAIPLFLLETAWLVLDWMFGHGLEVWAAQGDQARIDAAELAHIGRVRVLLVAVLILAVLAGIFRARWTVIAHLLVALLAGGVLTVVRHQWDHHHAPPPGASATAQIAESAGRGSGPVLAVVVTHGRRTRRPRHHRPVPRRTVHKDACARPWCRPTKQ
ncbi:DUF6234 family protein [Streptomyces sp. NPDC002888]|uniref:DUF6234 family protein n=1 Tax=Streptomyces sp. NPDC002888 TaxID=3364668 RepID=UPI0036A0CF33